MGILYRRGTKAMNDLVVGHVIEVVNEDDLRLFLIVLHRSGVTSRADTIFLFGSSSLASRFSFVIEEENESFFKLIRHYDDSSGSKGLLDSVLSFDSTRFWKSGKKDESEPRVVLHINEGKQLWGIRRLSNAMLTEIVRATMQHKKRSSIPESGILRELVDNGHILKNINLITSTESIQEASSVMGLSPNTASDYSIIHRGIMVFITGPVSEPVMLSVHWFNRSNRSDRSEEPDDVIII
ncbi:putative coatomer alpha subunit [Hibiscus syriacus]|uniref:Coatomer alpha subunit n=1 Tax=Hibiscus syriacus TaxID=106335 RepID=A0A6A3CNZ8_HIBSY|nr:putative coatomer alpha subunit [Hibiscus syriacus]